MTKTFMFDVHLLASIRVPAETDYLARTLLLEMIDAADANLGAWPNGDPILAEVSVLGRDGGMEPAFVELVEEDDDEAVAPEDVTLLSAAEFPKKLMALEAMRPIVRRFNLTRKDEEMIFAATVDPIAELAEIISPNISQAMRTMPR